MSKYYPKGFKTYRFKDNPLEKRFATTWLEYHEHPRSTPTLDYLLNWDGRVRPNAASDEQYAAARAVIQWLGSPVGQCFLRDVLASPEGKHLLEDIERTKK